MTPEDHDLALAATSHLPHIAASALASVIPPSALPVAAGAYRDGTRVAAADPDLWTAIYLENRQPLLNLLDQYLERLSAFRDALSASDSDGLKTLARDARQRRTIFESL